MRGCFRLRMASLETTLGLSEGRGFSSDKAARGSRAVLLNTAQMISSWAGTMLGFDLLLGSGEVSERFPPVSGVLVVWTAGRCSSSWAGGARAAVVGSSRGPGSYTGGMQGAGRRTLGKVCFRETHNWRGCT